MKLTATILALNLPSLGLASVYNYWAFLKKPSAGLSDQFGFNGVDVGYTGLQLCPDSRRRQVVHAAFSSFQNGTTTKHKNCHSGADGSLGVRCALDIFGDYSHFYNITVKNTGGTTWRGTLIDTVTGKSDVIGEWMLPSSAGKMLNGRVGFFEYYNWSDGTTNHDCSKQPFSSQVFFGNPTSKTKGASGGKIILIYEASECVKEAQPEGHSDWQGISDSGWFQEGIFIGSPGFST
ncbi:uncharacterized protein FOBCDRAFT_242350 [Fusarium oxysporum Fo47]|uniref:uncharacterized protein n=1 Tax=Fusarium oxysporum Fo47 TaxID=660027 RepID=UPI002869CFBD|nr:uncharacterized protein FOBCDRAFT_242350 [Fusarium oxysporum Fo47]WJG35972.1 hypothetical protein FOBCDRAFT_242350 [Fusarium oxysporum Fo47]